MSQTPTRYQTGTQLLVKDAILDTLHPLASSVSVTGSFCPLLPYGINAFGALPFVFSLLGCTPACKTTTMGDDNFKDLMQMLRGSQGFCISPLLKFLSQQLSLLKPSLQKFPHLEQIGATPFCTCLYHGDR